MSEEKNRRAIIDKETLIPIGFAITIAGCAWFISSLNSRVEAQEKRLTKIEEAITSIAEMKTDISVIKTKIENIDKTFANYDIELKK